MRINKHITQFNHISFQGKRVNLIVYNDVHASKKHINSFISEQDSFYKQNPDDINLTLCGGDLFLDENPNNAVVAEKIAKRTDAIAVGNHDIDGGNYLAKLIDKFGMLNKLLSINIFFSKETPLQDRICRSKIINKDGENIGIIGVSPFDFGKLTFINKKTDFIKTSPLSQTIEEIKKEIAILKKQGINKIFLLAHTGETNTEGYNYYEAFAKIRDIDVIIGGHDHREVDKWAISETGEPVKIIATGKSEHREFGENLDVIGKLNLEFDDNGVLIKENSKTTFVTLKENETEESTLNTIRKIKTPLKKADVLREHSEIGNLVADSNLWYVNNHTTGEKADFAFVNAGTIRANFDNTNITIEDIQSVLPFTTSTLLKTTLTKKQILETLAWCALSTSFTKVAPGLMQVSNMKYTINPDLSISNVHILNDDGSIKYNLDDYDDDKKFVAVYDIFLATGVAGLKELTKDCENAPDVELFGISRQKAMEEYLSKTEKLANYQEERIKITK